jgi:hypothetical protein
MLVHLLKIQALQGAYFQINEVLCNEQAAAEWCHASGNPTRAAATLIQAREIQKLAMQERWHPRLRKEDGKHAL